MHHYIAFLSTATRKTSGASFPYRRFSCFLSFHFRSSWVLASSAGCQGDGFLISHHCEQLLQFSLRSNTSALTVRSIISRRLFQFFLCVTSSRSVSYLVVKVRNIRVMTRLRHYLVPGLTVIPALHFIPRWLQPVVIRTKAKAATEGIVICGFDFVVVVFFASILAVSIYLVPPWFSFSPKRRLTSSYRKHGKELGHDFSRLLDQGLWKQSLARHSLQLSHAVQSRHIHNVLCIFFITQFVFSVLTRSRVYVRFNRPL